MVTRHDDRPGGGEDLPYEEALVLALVLAWLPAFVPYCRT
jgi:hypothetical protein